MTVADANLSLTRAPASAAAAAARPRRAGYYGMLDAWRGVACLWVVCHHAIGFLAEKDATIGASFGYGVALNGAMGVWMFFVISGYCIANTATHSLTTDRGGWALARGRRIFPPLWGSVVVAAASTLLATVLVHRGVLRSSSLADLDLPHQTAAFFVTNLTLTQELFHQRYLSGVYWTLCYEVGFYAVVAAGLAVSRRHGDARRLLNGLHALTAVTLAALLVAPRSVPYPFDLWPHFGLGVLVFDVVANGWRRPTAVAAGVVGAGVVAFLVQHPARASYLDRGGGVSLAVATAFAAVLLGLHPFDERLSRTPGARALGWVGLFSYSLYLTHMTLIGYAYKAAQMAHVLPRSLPAYLALTVAACVAFGWAFFRVCERPFLRTTTKRAVTKAAVTSSPSPARQST